MTDLDKMARELLGAEWRKLPGHVGAADELESGCELPPIVGMSVDAIRTALLTAPPGWKLVPVESNDDMQWAATDEQVGGHCHMCSEWDCTRDDARRVRDAMIAAAPQPDAIAVDLGALRRIATELRRRNAGPPAPKPVLGVELFEWADRIEAAIKEIDND